MIKPLILASASLRRRQLLLEMGVPFEVVVTEAAEILLPDKPEATVRANALSKLTWCMERHPGRSIIAADTVIDMDGHCIGKPGSISEATEFLKAFSGRVHAVLTGVAMVEPGSKPCVKTVRSMVTFKSLTESEIAKYFRVVNPLDKAGAYDINQNVEMIIEKYEGSFTNIVGLPMETVYEWLKHSRT